MMDENKLFSVKFKVLWNLESAKKQLEWLQTFQIMASTNVVLQDLNECIKMMNDIEITEKELTK